MVTISSLSVTYAYNTPLYIASTPIPLTDILGCCIKTIETCLGDEPSPVLLDLYKKKAKLVEGNEKTECISKACI